MLYHIVSMMFEKRIAVDCVYNIYTYMYMQVPLVALLHGMFGPSMEGAPKVSWKNIQSKPAAASVQRIDISNTIYNQKYSVTFPIKYHEIPMKKSIENMEPPLTC